MEFEQVFSAQAEVFLRIFTEVLSIVCFLRASGGVSAAAQSELLRAQFSPRKRRCFRPVNFLITSLPVFSAQAEVFLSA